MVLSGIENVINATQRNATQHNTAEDGTVQFD
jgi:hypothetical protein